MCTNIRRWDVAEQPQVVGVVWVYNRHKEVGIYVRFKASNTLLEWKHGQPPFFNEQSWQKRLFTSTSRQKTDKDSGVPILTWSTDRWRGKTRRRLKRRQLSQPLTGYLMLKFYRNNSHKYGFKYFYLILIIYTFEICKSAVRNSMNVIGSFLKWDRYN